MSRNRLIAQSLSLASLTAAAAIVALTLAPASPTFAQDPVPQTPPTDPAPQTPRTPGGPGTGRRGGFGGGQALPGGFGGGGAGVIARPRPYADVITEKAKTDKGLFTTHQIDDRVYFEIPTSQLGKEILWVTSLRQSPTFYGAGNTEVQNDVVRWEKRGDKILLRLVDYQARDASEGNTMKNTLALASIEPIVMTFDVKAYNDKEDNAPVIDVTSLFTSDVAEFSPRRAIGAGARMDASRTFVDRVKSLPTNIELDVLATYSTGGAAAFGGGGTPAPRRRAPRPNGPNSANSAEATTIVLHHSIVALPAVPMKPRLSDDRLGFFTTGFYEYGSEDNRVKPVRYINKWRLEKKDPTAAISEPVKPIIYYVGPEVPAKWRPYIKQAIEDWQPAFEQAGFKNAIIAKDAPTKDEDPNFDPDDIRYSVIRWLPSATENAYGPSITDPRTGEILNADIKVYHNLMKLSETWYFSQASPNDKRAQKLPLPDDLMGQLIRYAISHEVGHTLGLRHNFKASSSYTIANLRDPKFTAEWGDEASIMDYGRFNYVAQPGDGARLIPKQGPYDYFAIEWGYTPVDSKTPEGEKPALNKIAERQVKNPMLRFGGGAEDSETADDAHQQREDLGNDPVEATKLGLKNLDRIMGYLLPATTKPGEDYDRLQEEYDAVWSQRALELDHVAVLVGGFEQTSYHAGDPRIDDFTPVSAAKQKEAMQFLIANAFTTPTTLLNPQILERIESAGTADRVLGAETRVLNRLVEDARLKRLADYEAEKTGQPVYSLTVMMADLRKGIWSELAAPSVTIDPFRQNLQRAYVAALASKLAPDTGDAAAAGGAGGFFRAATRDVDSPVRPATRGALLDTLTSIQSALPKVKDTTTRNHLLDCQQTIKDALYPKG